MRTQTDQARRRSRLGAAGRLLALAALTLAGGAPMEAAEIRVETYGAAANDGKDDADGVRAAIEACRKAGPGSRLVFSPGRYHLAAGGDRKPILLLDGLENVTVEGNGAELVASGLSTLFHLNRCAGVTFRNLVIDWDPLPFTAGKVIASEGAQFDLEVVPPHTAQAGVRTEAWIEYDPERRRMATRGREHYQLGFAQPTEVVRPGVVRCFVNRPGAQPRVGALVVVRHQVYSFQGFTVWQSSDTRIENVTLYACPGMGLYAGESRDVTLRRFDVIIRPDSGRWMSATADATHFNNCRGTITLEDCTFEGMGDDAANLHSMYLVVAERIDDRTLRLRQGRQPSGAPALPQPGDRLGIGGGENPLAPYATLVVESATADQQTRTVVVRLTAPLPERAAKGDVVGNASTCPSARIRRCKVLRNRARGMLLQTRDILLEECVFEDVSGAALHVCSDANYWWEGQGVRDVVIRNNRFTRCHFGVARRGGVIDLFAEVGKALAGPGVHRRVTIEGNTIEDADGSAIHVGSAEDVTIRGNTFLRPAGAAVVVAKSRAVRITGNELVGGTTGIRIQDGTDPAGVKVEGNEGF